MASDLEATQIIEEAKKWEEGGIYRVALHTAVGALGTGTVEGAVTTGGVAAAAPTINAVSRTISQKLINQGVSQDKAEAATNLITSLAITAATQSAGANTTSTAMAVNVDANNRQLHHKEIDIIELLAQEYAKEKGIDVEEAILHLTRGALYHIDADWKSSLDQYVSENIDDYKEAYQYLLKRSAGHNYDSLYEMLSDDHPDGYLEAQNKAPDALNSDSNDVQNKVVYTLNPDTNEYEYVVDLGELVVTAECPPSLCSYYEEVGKLFTATEEHYHDTSLLLSNSTLDYIKKYAGISSNERSFIENSTEALNAYKKFKSGEVEGAKNYIQDSLNEIKSVYQFVSENNIDDLKQHLKVLKESTEAIVDELNNDPSQYIDNAILEEFNEAELEIRRLSNYVELKHEQGLYSDIAEHIGKVSGEIKAQLVSAAAGGAAAKVAMTAGKVATAADNIADVTTTAIKQKTDNTRPNNANTSTPLASTECSFHGSMQVKTLHGYKPISQIRLSDWVFAKNEITGKTNYRQVLQTINSIDPDTTRITIVNSAGVKQTIISDGLHPYFVDFTGDMTPPKPSTGHSYKGNLTHAYWVGAKDIEIGHRLIDDKGNYQTVIAIHTEQTPLDSYNLEVDTDHTFFIKGIDGVESVWVHNDCYRQLPDGYQKQPDGTYIVNINGKQITLIETKVGNETKYYTSDHKEGDPYRNVAGQAVDEQGQYVADPNKLNTDLTRPSLRADTKRLIEASHDYNADGKALDDDGNVIEPPYHYGHKEGWENRRILAAATELGWDQATLNDYINARPGHFELQNDKFNLSHQGENKSLEGLDEIKDDMNDFLNKRDKLCKLDPQTNQCKKI